MSLKLEQMMKKADEKGYAKNKSSEKKIIKPWQEQAIPKINSQKDNTRNTIVEIETNVIENWEFHDRPESELGDIKALANEFLSIGQQQPCVVRPHPDNPEKYELIIGERRWRAAIQANIPLKVIIANYDDNKAGLAQAAENDNRVDLSDYAKGISFSRLIDQKIIQQKDLVEQLGRPKQYISALLSFSKIPIEIQNAIGDMSKVSARTAETIKRLSSKGDDHINALIKYADKIKTGKYGANKLADAIQQHITNAERINKERKKILLNGRHLLTIRQDNNYMPSIHFPKNTTQHLSEIGVDIEQLGEEIAKLIDSKFQKSAHAD